MGGGRLKIDFLNRRRGGEAVLGDGRDLDGRARRRTSACRRTGTASTAPPRCSAPARSTAPTPTSTWAGSTTAAASDLYKRADPGRPQAQRRRLLRHSPCRHSRSAGSRRVKRPRISKGLKYRTVGLASNVMQAMGASVAQLPGPEILPAMEKGVIDAFEFNNPTSDSRFGAAGRRQVLLPGLLPSGVGSHRSRLQQGQIRQPGQGAAGRSSSIAARPPPPTAAGRPGTSTRRTCKP